MQTRFFFDQRLDLERLGISYNSYNNNNNNM